MKSLSSDDLKNGKSSICFSHNSIDGEQNAKCAMFVLRNAGLLTCGGVHGVHGVPEAGAVLVVRGRGQLTNQR